MRIPPPPRWIIWMILLVTIVIMLAPGCVKQDTLKCYSGEVGKYEQVPCPVRS